MEIALSAVTNAGRLRRAAVTAEVSAHVILLAVQRIAAHPCHVTADSVLLSEAGDVRVLTLAPANPHQVEIELRQLLGELIGLAPAAPPALKAAAERGAGGGLENLEAELHAALIPINHAAARRALARLYRETRRANAAAGAPLAALAQSPAPPEVALPGGELEIDVEVEDPGLTSTPDGSGAGPEVEQLEEHVACRSDVGQLLSAFLEHTRSEARMSQDLRRMLGVEATPDPAGPAPDRVSGPLTDPKR